MSTETVIEEIAAERRRQIEAEGWTPEHDDGHDGGEMVMAAITYGVHAAAIAKLLKAGFQAEAITAKSADAPQPSTWPWSRRWWKPKGQRRDLVKAAALIVAEIERLDRASA